MMRFYWKATPESRDHAGVKCKMLRPVAFPADNFDMYEFCTKRVQAVLKVERDRVIALENEKFKKGAAAAAAGSTAAPASASVSAPAPAAGAGRAAAASDVEMASDDPDLAAALAMSIAPASAPAPAAVSDKPIGYGLPAGFRGLYGELLRFTLFTLVTKASIFRAVCCGDTQGSQRGQRALHGLGSQSKQCLCKLTSLSLDFFFLNSGWRLVARV
jgi:hypothetical protein